MSLYIRTEDKPMRIESSPGSGRHFGLELVPESDADAQFIERLGELLQAPVQINLQPSLAGDDEDGCD